MQTPRTALIYILVNPLSSQLYYIIVLSKKTRVSTNILRIRKQKFEYSRGKKNISSQKYFLEEHNRKLSL